MELLADAAVLLNAIAYLGRDTSDPFTDPDTLARAVELGLLDAPHLRGNSAACGKIVTRMIGGACLAIDRSTGQPLPETERVTRALGRSVPGGIARGLPNAERIEREGSHDLDPLQLAC